MEEVIDKLDRTRARVQDSRKDMLGRIDALIGELTTAKTNIER
jgi:hypothetical protein